MKNCRPSLRKTSIGDNGEIVDSNVRHVTQSLKAGVNAARESQRREETTEMRRIGECRSDAVPSYQLPANE